MSAIVQRGTPTVATSANTTSLSCNKPTGVVSGDVMIALVSGWGTTTSTGWTVIGHGTGQGTTFDGTWLYKVAGGSEPASYSFTLSVGSSPMAIHISAWSGVDTSGSPIGGSTFTGNAGGSEPQSSGACTNTPLAMPFYSRSTTVSSNTTGSFTESAGTELTDQSIASGGGFTYSQVVVQGTEASGNPSAINITFTGTETANILASFTLITLITSVSPAAGAAAATVSAKAPTVQTGIATTAGVAAATASAKAPTVLTGRVATPGTAAATVAVQQVGYRAYAATATAVASAYGIQSFLGTPGYRTYRLPADSRTIKVAADVRRYQVESDPGRRIIAIGWDDQ